MMKHLVNPSRNGLAILALFILASGSMAADFSGTVDGNWLNDANWSGGSVPTLADVAILNDGFSVTALSSAANGGTMQAGDLKIGSDGGHGLTNTLTSEIAVELDGRLEVGLARSAAGSFTGQLNILDADVKGARAIDIGGTAGGADRTADGEVTLTNGNLTVQGAVDLGIAESGGGDARGALTLINGDLISSRGTGRIQVGDSSRSPGTGTGAIRIEDGAIRDFFSLTIGTTGGLVPGNAEGTVTLIDSEAYLSHSTRVGSNTGGVGELILDRSFISTEQINLNAGSTLEFHLDGTQRAAAGNVGSGNHYGAIDVSGEFAALDGDVDVEFGFAPGIGDRFDLISLAAGETFFGQFSAVRFWDLPAGVVATSMIVPGDAQHGEIFRVVIVPEPMLAVWPGIVAAALIAMRRRRPDYSSI